MFCPGEHMLSYGFCDQKQIKVEKKKKKKRKKIWQIGNKHYILYTTNRKAIY